MLSKLLILAVAITAVIAITVPIAENLTQIIPPPVPGCTPTGPGFCNLVYISSLDPIPPKDFDYSKYGKYRHVKYNVSVYDHDCNLLATRAKPPTHNINSPGSNVIKDPPKYKMSVDSSGGAGGLSKELKVTKWQVVTYGECMAPGGFAGGKCIAPIFRYGGKKNGGRKACYCGYKGLPEGDLWACQCAFGC